METPEVKPDYWVQVKSGGPPMKVLEVSSIALCQWHDAAGVAHEAQFPIPCLQLAQPAELKEKD